PPTPAAPVDTPIATQDAPPPQQAKPKESFFARFMRESLGHTPPPAAEPQPTPTAQAPPQPWPTPKPAPLPLAPQITLPDTPTNEDEARIYSSILERLRNDQHTHITDTAAPPPPQPPTATPPPDAEQTTPSATPPT
ncbi:MAG: hypothetical protein AAF823_01070, partial [Planctomycetota bacterium]